MSTSEVLSPTVGSACDLRRVASAPEGGIWVCFARSESNPEILRLAPACDRPLTSDAVRICSANSLTRWLIPGVEIALHSLDLRASATGENYEISADDDGSERGSIETGNDDAVRERLSEVALRIEAHFHEPAERVIPSVDECRLDLIEQEGPTALFSWQPDPRRTYRFTREGAQWRLAQRYDGAQAVPNDALIPFKIRDSVVSFSVSDDGTATAAVGEPDGLLKALGLQYAADTHELRRKTSAIVIPIASAIRGRPFSAGAFRDAPSHPENLEPTHAVFVQLAANDARFRVAASFATAETSSAEGRRTVRFDWNGDVVELVARPDPTGRRIQLQVGIDSPRWAKDGSRLELRFQGMQVEPLGIVLKETAGRLQGSTSVAVPWKLFAAEEATAVEVLASPGAKD